MRKQKLYYSGFIVAASIVVSGGALADNCSGNWTNTGQSSDTIDLGDGHTLTTWFARGSVSSANSPFNTVGACGGYVLTTPDGKARTVYACTRKDKDGGQHQRFGKHGARRRLRDVDPARRYWRVCRKNMVWHLASHKH